MCPPLWDPRIAQGSTCLQGVKPCLLTRVEERSGKLLEAEQRLQEERQRAVLLEQHLQKMRLEPSRTSVSQRASRSKPGRSTAETQP